MSLPMQPGARESIQRIRPYQQGKPIEEVQRELGLAEVIKLASNENPLGPSPRAIEAMTRTLAEVNLYPDGGNYRLKAGVAEVLEVSPDNIVFGAGSSTVLRLLADAFLGPGDEVVYAHPSFILYEFLTHLGGATPITVPLNAVHGHNLPAMAAAVTPHTKIVIICNPNNPTGTAVSRAELDAFMAQVPDSVLVVLDEAYFEYATGGDYPDGIDYLRAGRNVLVLRTFSKAHGLAGLRVGYGVGRPDIIGALRRVREPFNVNAVAQAAALAALGDQEHLARGRAVNDEGKAMLYAGMEALKLPYIPTAANFFMFKCPVDDAALYQAILAQGVVVRPGRAFAMPGWLRVTIGTVEQNRRFLAALTVALAELTNA